MRAHGGRLANPKPAVVRRKFQSAPAHGGRSESEYLWLLEQRVSIRARAWRAIRECEIEKIQTQESFNPRPRMAGDPWS